MLIRPELLELEPDPAGDGEVVGREFRGHDVFYRVLLDGVELVSQRPSNEDVPLGDARPRAAACLSRHRLLLICKVRLRHLL